MDYARFTIRGQFMEPARLPEFKGSMIRGSLGHAFKSIVCAVRVKVCSDCLLRSTCVHARLFEVKPDPARRSGLSSLPHPYVLDPSALSKREYAKGEEFSFDLTLFGPMIELLPYFIYAVEEMGRRGWTRERHPFELIAVESAGQQLYASGAPELPEQLPRQALSLKVLAEDKTREQATLELQTPLRFKYDRQLSGTLDEPRLLRLLYRRLHSLWQTFEEQDPPWPQGSAFPPSGVFRIREQDLTWQEQGRYSTRQRSEMQLGGLLGQVQLEGDLQGILPLLRAAEVTHLGKETSFGLGKVRLLHGQAGAPEAPGQAS